MSVTRRLWFTRDGADITDGIELRNGKAKPGGWSTHEVWLVENAGEPQIEHKIADLYCGEPCNLEPGFGFRFDDDVSARDARWAQLDREKKLETLAAGGLADIAWRDGKAFPSGNTR